MLMREMRIALDKFEANPDVGAVVITGSERAFAGGWSSTNRNITSFLTSSPTHSWG